MKFSQINPNLFSPALTGSDYGEAFLEESSGLSIRYEDSKVEDIGSVIDLGIGLRHLKKTGTSIQTFQAVSQKFDPEEALRLKESLLGKGNQETSVSFKSREEFSHPFRINPKETPLKDKINLLKSIDSSLRKNE